MVLSVGGIALTAGTIFIDGMGGLYSLIGVSACMSLMFPTIYGIALRGMGDDAKFGAAGLIMAIVGGTFLPKLQALIIDGGSFFSMPAVNLSFILPLICFVFVAMFGYRSARVYTS
jgi:FHS family L-fucose permease-like MFS transporter